MFLDRIEKRMSYSELNNYKWNSVNSNNLEEETLLKEATYFKCIKYISDSVAKISIRILKDTDKGEEIVNNHEYSDILSLRANPFSTTVNTIRTLVTIGEHEGIGVLYIHKNGLFPCRVKRIIINDVGEGNMLMSKSNSNNSLGYELVYNNKTFYTFDSECIVYRSGLSYNGLKTNPTKDYLRDSINTLKSGSNMLKTMLNSGLTNKVVVQASDLLKDSKELKKSNEFFQDLYNYDGRIFTVPPGFNISSLNSNLADSQFKELRSLSKKEIAVAFGLSPSLIGEESSNNLVDETNRFIQDTLLVKLQDLEQEMTYKLLTPKEIKEGYKIRFNVNNILRVSPKEQCEIICNYSKNGIYSLEYARKLAGASNDMKGETVTLPSGQILLKQLIEGQASWQKDVNNDNQTDISNDNQTDINNDDVEGGESNVGNKEE